MFWLDYLILGLLTLGAILGAVSGLFRQVARVVCLVAAVYGAILLNDQVAIWLHEGVLPATDASLCRVLAYVVVFLGVYIALFFLAYLLDHGIRMVQLGMINRLLGAVLGLAKMALLLALLCLALNQVPHPQPREWLEKSTLAPALAGGMEWLVDAIPPQYKTELAEGWKSFKEIIRLQEIPEGQEKGKMP